MNAIRSAEVGAKLKAAGFGRPDRETEALTDFLNLLTRWNRTYNLTGIRSAEELISRHLVESLALASLLEGPRIADVGTGAGLPGIPLAIAAPEREFTLIESRAKRVRFLRHVIATLGLGNARVAHSRAEDLRAVPAFDTVLARAVARPEALVEIARPLMAIGSILVVLTSTELAQRFARVAADFAVRPARTSTRLKSAVVVLERIDAP
jgi:16S rRNA (guanine527-N7)-methyltransferase